MGLRLQVIDNLLEHNAEVQHHNNFNERTALQAACRRGDLGVVRRLLEHGAEVSDIANGFVDASASGNLALVKLLSDHGVDLNHADNAQKNTPLLSAVKARQFEVADYLIEQGADVSCQDSNGNTALLLMANMKRRRWYHFGRN